MCASRCCKASVDRYIDCLNPAKKERRGCVLLPKKEPRETDDDDDDDDGVKNKIILLRITTDMENFTCNIFQLRYLPRDLQLLSPYLPTLLVMSVKTR